MDTVIHQVVEQPINHPVTLNRQLPGKRRADNTHMKVTLAFTGVARVLVAFIDHLKQFRHECSLQALANLLDHGCGLVTHGSTLRNGLTEVEL
jgi:hypothetical protein